MLNCLKSIYCLGTIFIFCNYAAMHSMDAAVKERSPAVAGSPALERASGTSAAVSLKATQEQRNPLQMPNKEERVAALKNRKQKLAQQLDATKDLERAKIFKEISRCNVEIGSIEGSGSACYDNQGLEEIDKTVERIYLETSEHIKQARKVLRPNAGCDVSKEQSKTEKIEMSSIIDEAEQLLSAFSTPERIGIERITLAFQLARVNGKFACIESQENC